MPRTTTLYELNGQRFTLGQWANIYGVPAARVTSRVKAGGSLESALTEPVTKQTITYRGKTLTLAQWADKTGLPVTTIRQRLNYGWPPAAIITTPARPRSTNKSLMSLTHNGETLTYDEWAVRIGIASMTLRKRIASGWSIEEAVTTPCLRLQRTDRGEGSSLDQDGRDRPHSIVRDPA